MEKIKNNWFVWGWVWIGMIIGLSFLATIAKFQSPLIEREVALDVGVRTFALFNRVEWVMVLILSVSLFLKPTQLMKWLLRLVVVVLALQSFYLLPHLNEVAQTIIMKSQLPEEQVPQTQNIYHHLYVISEIVKIFLLALWSSYYSQKR